MAGVLEPTDIINGTENAIYHFLASGERLEGAMLEHKYGYKFRADRKNKPEFNDEFHEAAEIVKHSIQLLLGEQERTARENGITIK